MKLRFLFQIICLALLCANHAIGQPSIGKSVNILVGFAPGGGADTLARALSKILEPKFQVNIENVAGGGGLSAVEKFQNLPPDDKNFLMITIKSEKSGINPIVQSGSVDNLTPIAQIQINQVIYGIFGLQNNRETNNFEQQILESTDRLRSMFSGLQINSAGSSILEESIPGRVKAKQEKIAEQNRKKAEADKKRQEFLNSPEGKRKVAAEQEEERKRQAAFAKEFPYRAEISCGNGYVYFPTHVCFEGETSIEITNGKEYSFFARKDLLFGRQFATNPGEIAAFNLRSTFAIKMQNSGKDMILGLKIVQSSNNSVVFEKKVTRFDVISVRN